MWIPPGAGFRHSDMNTDALTRRSLKGNLASRQDRLCWLGGSAWWDNHTGQQTAYMWAMLFTLSWFLLFHTCSSPKPLNVSLVPCINICPLKLVVWTWNAFPAVHPMTQVNTLPPFWECSGIDSSWWVSHLDMGAQAHLGQARENRTGCHLFWAWGLGPCLPSPQRSLGHRETGWSCQGWRLLVWAWGQPGQDALWAAPPATASLCPCVCLQLIFYCISQHWAAGARWKTQPDKVTCGAGSRPLAKLSRVVLHEQQKSKALFRILHVIHLTALVLVLLLFLPFPSLRSYNLFVGESSPMSWAF